VLLSEAHPFEVVKRPRVVGHGREAEHPVVIRARVHEPLSKSVSIQRQVLIDRRVTNDGTITACDLADAVHGVVIICRKQKFSTLPHVVLEEQDRRGGVLRPHDHVLVGIRVEVREDRLPRFVHLLHCPSGRGVVRVRVAQQIPREEVRVRMHQVGGRQSRTGPVGVDDAGRKLWKELFSIQRQHLSPIPGVRKEFLRECGVEKISQKALGRQPIHLDVSYVLLFSCMKYLIVLAIILIVGIAGYAWWSTSSLIDSSGKIHVDLYEGASGTWDPQMVISPFERSPSTSITIRWQPPEETYNHFVVAISKADGTLVRKESGEHDRLSLDPDGLEPGTEYVFALQACLDPRCEAWLVAQDEYRGTTEESQTTDEEAVLE